ncbi:MAG TPA: ABC transporter substrate-binding protein, partial [Casimicrobiaceae bacterium]|nr:ABC transporter substrate-binding protein [Casimicrobiaceae bacterium]
MQRSTKGALAFVCALALSVAALPVRAEMSEIHVAEQYGISYLPLMIMQDRKLIEKYAKAEGIDVKVAWSKFAGGNVMTDALLSGGLQFASGGVGPLITLWAKTHGNLDVRAVAAINSMPLYLVSSDPAVKTVKDLTDRDRIAMPAAKISIQAVTLQMAAEKAFGPGQEHRFDHLTVSLSHPDAMTALLSGKSEINGHFGSPPFQYQELEHPGVHLVLDSYDVLGGPVTFNTVWTMAGFRRENPKIYRAFVEALDESMKIINGDKKAAAEAYLRLAKSKLPLDSVVHMLNDPKIVFTTTPQGVIKYADFMYKV